MTYKGIDVTIKHNNPDKQSGAVIVSISPESGITAFANHSLTGNEVLRFLDLHWGEFSRAVLQKAYFNQCYIVDKNKLPKNIDKAKPSHVSSNSRTLEGLVNRYRGWHHIEQARCDNCGRVVSDYYSYKSFETGDEYKVCENCRNTILSLSPYRKEISVNFEGSRKKH